MPTTTTTYSFNKPVVGADEDDWGGYLNGNWDSVDNLLDGTTPVTGIDINSGTLDGVTIGGTTAGAGTFTTLTATTSITGTLATAAQPNVTSLGTLTGLTVSGSTSLAGASTSADITFGDNDKAIFGAGSDLQIYHSGTHSFIEDKGTGNLYIDGSSAVIIRGDTASTISATFNDAGAVTLRNNGDTKLATTSTGIDVTGTVTADGLTVENSTAGTTVSPQYANIEFTGYAGADRSAVRSVDTSGSSNGGQFEILTANASNSNTRRVNINRDGDISFYEDTGTTAKFFWDASAESLGIGTSSPSAIIHATNSGGFSESLALFEAAPTRNGYFYINGDDNRRKSLVFQSGGVDKFSMGVGDSDELSASSFFIGSGKTGGSGADLVIDSSGNVGIGTATITEKLEVAGDIRVQNAVKFRADDDAENGSISLSDSDELRLASFGAAGHVTVTTGSSNTERMRIDSSGNVGIGTTPHSNSKLHILDASSSLDDYTVHIEGYTPAVVWQDISGDPSTDFAVQVDGSAMMFRYGDASTGTQLASEAMRIDSSGRVGIGTSSPSRKVSAFDSVDGKNLELSQTSAYNSGYQSGIVFSAKYNIGGSVTDLASIRGGKENTTNDNWAGNLRFYTRPHLGSDTERMRIDSSGNLLVGKTVADTTTKGHHFNNSVGYASHVASNNTALYVNRQSSDGNILQFQKDGTTVGSIESRNGTHITVQSGGAGTLKSDTTEVARWLSTHGFYPVTNNTFSLGTSALNWKDLYLSGGVYLGGTGASNQLTDYETGTWTPAINHVSGFSSTSISDINARYTKIGRQVTLEFEFKLSDSTGSVVAGDDVVLTSGCLPFTPQDGGHAVGTVGLQEGMATGENVAMGYAGFSTGNELGLLFHTVDGSVSRSSLMGGIVTYFTNS